jgi:hypothetical protein
MPAVKIPKAPPALMHLVEGARKPATLRRLATAWEAAGGRPEQEFILFTHRSQNVRSRKKNSDARAIDDFRDAMRKRNVTIPHAQR